MSAGLVTLDAFAAFAPSRSIAIEEVAGSLRLSRYQTKVFRRVHGLDRLRDAAELSLFDLVRTAADAVLRDVADRDAIRYLIFAHTIQEIAPAHIDAAAVLRDLLGLPAAEAFAVTQQNCASGLAAIDVAGELLRAGGDPRARALVVTGEKPFSRMVRLIENTTIMGEASSACLVGLDGGGSRVRSYVARTRGQFAEVHRPAPAVRAEFGESYTGHFVAAVTDAVARAGLRLSDITLVVPHNVNRSSWHRVMHALGLDRQRVFLDNVPRYGHCFCADPLLNLVTLRDEGRLEPGGYYLLTAVGLGATYAAMVIEG